MLCRLRDCDSLASWRVTVVITVPPGRRARYVTHYCSEHKTENDAYIVRAEPLYLEAAAR